MYMPADFSLYVGLSSTERGHIGHLSFPLHRWALYVGLFLYEDGPYMFGPYRASELSYAEMGSCICQSTSVFMLGFPLKEVGHIGGVSFHLPR